MALLAWIQLLSLAAFAGLAGASLLHWHRRRGPPAAWLTLTFTILATLVAIRVTVGPVDPAEASSVQIRAAVVLLALVPYCLFHFTLSFGPASSSRVPALGLLGVSVATFAVPAVATPFGSFPWWYVAYTALFLAYWTVVSGLSVRRLWAAGRGAPTVARRRMRTLALAAVALTLALFLLILASRAHRASSDPPARIAGLITAALFLVGFAPPRRLRARWRRDEVDAFRAAEADLMRADTAEGVAAILLPHAAALVGAESAVLTGVDGRVRASYGMTEAAAASVGARFSVAASPGGEARVLPGLVAIPVRTDWLAVTTNASAPMPGDDEFALLRSLGHLAGLALDRAELSDRERDSRRELAERESELADAQRTAQLGSYVWDLSSRSMRWSEELCRLLELQPDQIVDWEAQFMTRIHPEDREWMAAVMSTLPHRSTPSCFDYQVILPSGRKRWIQGRVQPTLGADGFPIRLAGTLQDITERKASEEASRYQATHDPLTNLPNRILFHEHLGRALGRDGRTSMAVLLLDLDRFTWVNDSLGHPAGDALLVTAACRMRAELTEQEVLARFGGDEFAVLCEDTSVESAVALAERLRSALATPFRVHGDETAVTASVGIAYLSGQVQGESPETLVRDADVALNRAKERGRDRHEVFDPSTRLITMARHETVNAMRRGIERNEFVLHYQPEVDLRTNQVKAVEALVRWRHPQRGLIPPNEFIPLAEHTGLIVGLGSQVLRSACRQAVAWRRTNPAMAVGVSVNLAARQLMAPELASVVNGALEDSGLDPSLLILEITESVLIDDSETSAQALRALKAIGVRIAVDDFGTGFSALTRLKRFPLDILKIDRSFVGGLGRTEEDRAIVAGLVDLAHAFGLTTVAEGVETTEQLEELQALGCEQGQGYLWSRPQPARLAAAWMVRHAKNWAVEPRPPSPARRSGHARQRVLLVDDDRSVRYLLRLVFEGDDRFEVAGEATDGREAIALARHLRPDVILLDLAMPGMGGLEALPRIEAVVPDAKVIVLTGLEQPAVAETARRRGADAFVVKGDDPLELPVVLEALLN